ncbi:MAG: hypothetical protein FWG36_00245 [Oscillospiraceae bacterium]|nr:hypothetical protein [Oscillospiraceae bacterium]
MKNDPPKVMNVLERMGMVRKTEEAADITETQNETETTVFESTPVVIPDVEMIAEPEEVRVEQSVSNPFAQTPSDKWGELGITSEAGERMNDSSFWDDSPALSTDTDKFMEVEEIYRALSMKIGGTDTIYLIEEYMKTLPDSLPAESRRAIIMKIVGASGFDFDRLLNDGIERVTKLNEYAATFAQQTDKIVARHNGELDALEKQIQRVRELIGERKNLHKKQFLSIENEAQRLKEVLDFVTK